MVDVKCVNESEFLRNENGWKSYDLLPGEYTIRVRANSLAAHGEWSEEQKFFVTDLNAMSWKKILLISFAMVVLFISSTGLISLYLFNKAKRNLPQTLEYVSMNPEYMPAYEADEWEVDRDNIVLISDLGEGSFGKVFQGLLKNTVAGVTECHCAVKTVRANATARDKVEFLAEATIMKQFNCHHVVKLLGVVSAGPQIYVCMELMALGDLKNYLRKCRPDCQPAPDHELPSKQLVHLMSCQIADGMSYLAARKFVHRDLAGRNCMVAADLTVKIGDFGMTRDVYETDYYRKGDKGKVPVRWMAPESLRDGVFSSQSDVWSYGVVLWEMVTLGEQPYQGYGNEKVVAIVKGGGNPGKPENCPEDLFSVMQLCWSWHQKARPTFGEIIDSLFPEIEDTDMGNKFKATSYYIRVEKNNSHVVHFEDEDGPLESSPLTGMTGLSSDGVIITNNSDPNKNISSEANHVNDGKDQKPKFMPSAVQMDGWQDSTGSTETNTIVNGGNDEMMDEMISASGSPDDHEEHMLMKGLIKASGTNTMSIRSNALSTATDVTTISNNESISSNPSTRHNSNTTTTSTNTNDGVSSSASSAIQQPQAPQPQQTQQRRELNSCC
jgi:serine/threonine protein kinase